MSRRQTRFEPEMGTVAQIDLSEDVETFKPKLVSLVSNESYGGCALIFLRKGEPEIGAKCRVKVGDLPVLPAEIRWFKVLDTGVYKAGFRYLK